VIKLIEQVKKILSRKESFEEKCKFLCDTIRLLAADKRDYGTVKEIFMLLLDTFKANGTELPRVLPAFLQKHDDITERYCLTVSIIDSVYRDEEFLSSWP